MIGTHNSFTYLKAKKPILELFSFMWRTQTKTIDEQLKLGVRYFDVRVRRSKNKWILCHGIVDFEYSFYHLYEIPYIFRNNRVRIILERGKDKGLFIQEIQYASKYKELSFACIKNGWEIILDRDPNIYDYTYRPWISNKSFLENIKRFQLFFSTIKKWARKHNPVIDDTLIQSEDLYFMDHV